MARMHHYLTGRSGVEFQSSPTLGSGAGSTSSLPGCDRTGRRRLVGSPSWPWQGLRPKVDAEAVTADPTRRLSDTSLRTSVTSAQVIAAMHRLQLAHGAICQGTTGLIPL